MRGILLSFFTSCISAFACTDLTVGYRSFDLAQGQKAIVWYPATAPEAEFAYSDRLKGSVAMDAEPASCDRFPLAVFSHGGGGSKTQSVFLLEQLARRGYVVAAVDHADANGELKETDPAFRDPETWTSDSHKGRGQDIRLLIDTLLTDPQLGNILDPDKIAAIGHSLGGYTIFGLAGGWESWYEPRVKAVLGLSPYLDPYLVQNRVPAVKVPKMYQGGTLDLGITPSIKKENGVYDQSSSGKFFGELRRAGHLEWTNSVCGDTGTIEKCLATETNASFIVNLAADFLRFTFTREVTPLLRQGAPGLASYKSDLIRAPILIGGESNQ